ncbi:MAG TPA: hypothetical protein VHR36_14720 [Pyrinomonadaceae bacterium]|nr:hypothetical protein [Pyrinomonadaceae bacterium]
MGAKTNDEGMWIGINNELTRPYRALKQRARLFQQYGRDLI